jgi:hypothetical protein
MMQIGFVRGFLFRGFKLEWRKRRGNWVDGYWEDILIMGVLDDEWAELYPENCQLSPE